MFNKFILFLCSFLLILSSAQVFAERPLLKQLSGRSTAPAFEYPDLNDKIHKLADYKGKPIVINFWATWCPPCRKEMPSMNRAWKHLKEEGIQMLAINVGEDEAAVHVYQNEHPIDFPILLDPTSESLEAWRIRGLPTTYIISPNGAVAYSAVGPREWDDTRILDKIRALKSAEPVIKEAPKSNDKSDVIKTGMKEEVKEKSFTDTVLDFFK
ncbi:MAG: TlpA family protein disulfide reductase [Cocleimonas sp.]|nr:TlpA family protein disulfide reductase [Cocleimonas sp.]